MGGGGYDIWRVVPRAWARIWLEMKELIRETISRRIGSLNGKNNAPSPFRPAGAIRPIYILRFPASQKLQKKMHKPSAKHYMRYDLSSSKEQNKKRPLRRGRFLFFDDDFHTPVFLHVFVCLVILYRLCICITDSDKALGGKFFF